MTDDFEPSTASSRERMRESIIATLDEIVLAHRVLGDLPPDTDEMAEAAAIIDRIERRMRSCEARPAPDIEATYRSNEGAEVAE